MPRIQVDELVGYQFGVAQGNAPGDTEQQPIWVLQFEQQTPLGLHRVVISFTEEGKLELVRQLTGGVILASAQNGHV